MGDGVRACPTAEELRAEFLLDPSITFLNHGSSGARPRAVIERYQSWQRELEREPVDFVERRLPELVEQARERLAEYLGVAAGDVAFTQNATTGVNIAGRALDLRPGDEVLMTTLEYGACDLAWEWVCARTGARVVRAEIPLPVDDVVGRLFARKTAQTRAVFVSHITSSAGLRLPVETIVARARAEGLVTIIDGAHAPGQVALDLKGLGADFYAGSCHKWLGAPRGAGFLYVKAARQPSVEGAIVGWGHERPSTFISRTEGRETRDESVNLVVPEAIAFQRRWNWEQVQARCRALTIDVRNALCELLGTEPLAPPEMLLQMATVRLRGPAPELRSFLFDEHQIEVAVAGDLLRVSIAAYTTRDDVERLLLAIPPALKSLQVDT